MERADARARILAALRATPIDAAPLPTHDGPWTASPDLVAAFRTAAEKAGSDCVMSRGEKLVAALAPTIERIAPRRIVSTLPELPISTGALAEIDPHRYADVDLAIVRGEFGVSENGAIWITDRDVSERSLWFLAEHLAVVLARDAIVPHMHAAYERIGELDRPFGMFLAGPSKTADIEQALVIGAHGPRSLTIVLTNG